MRTLGAGNVVLEHLLANFLLFVFVPCDVWGGFFFVHGVQGDFHHIDRRVTSVETRIASEKRSNFTNQTRSGSSNLNQSLSNNHYINVLKCFPWQFLSYENWLLIVFKFQISLTLLCPFCKISYLASMFSQVTLMARHPDRGAGALSWTTWKSEFTYFNNPSAFIMIIFRYDYILFLALAYYMIIWYWLWLLL